MTCQFNIMKIRMYGTRGIMPTPGWDSKKYGGNTSCIALRLEDSNDINIIDAGTGIIKLGQELVNQKVNFNIRIFLTHCHMDHIQGFPFFLPVYDPGNHITVYSPRSGAVSTEKIFQVLMNDNVNPLYLGKLRANIQYEYIDEKGMSFKTMKLKVCRLNHPVYTLGFRIEHRGKILSVTTDHEPPENLVHKSKGDKDYYELSDLEYASFVENSDLLIADAQYLPDEVKQYHGWGHANLNYMVNQAVQANVRKLVITHHDPNRTDLQLDTILEHYRSLLVKKGSRLELIGAKEIEEYNL